MRTGSLLSFIARNDALQVSWRVIAKKDMPCNYPSCLICIVLVRRQDKGRVVNLLQLLNLLTKISVFSGLLGRASACHVSLYQSSWLSFDEDDLALLKPLVTRDLFSQFF